MKLEIRILVLLPMARNLEASTKSTTKKGPPPPIETTSTSFAVAASSSLSTLKGMRRAGWRRGDENEEEIMRKRWGRGDDNESWRDDNDEMTMRRRQGEHDDNSHPMPSTSRRGTHVVQAKEQVWPSN
jgi:hypothetical protein